MICAIFFCVIIRVRPIERVCCRFLPPQRSRHACSQSSPPPCSCSIRYPFFSTVRFIEGLTLYYADCTTVQYRLRVYII